MFLFEFFTVYFGFGIHQKPLVQYIPAAEKYETNNDDEGQSRQEG